MSIEAIMESHWLTIDTAGNRDLIRGCHCGFKADPESYDYGDSVLKHIVGVAVEAGRAAVLEEIRQRGDVIVPAQFARDLDEWMSDPANVSGESGERLRDRYRRILNGEPDV